ncbi:MAG: ferritin family protein [Anaerolineales bacterium]|jgi:rubrerythrin
MNIRKVFEYALQREREGKAFFLNNAERLNSAAAVEAFKVIAGEEQRHIEFIQAQIDALDAKETGVETAQKTTSELDETQFFANRADKEMIDQTVNEAMVADLPVLRMAYLIERDFSEFYHQAASKTEGDAKIILDFLARWESGHERLFKAMHDEAFEKYAEMPWGG